MINKWSLGKELSLLMACFSGVCFFLVFTMEVEGEEGDPGSDHLWEKGLQLENISPAFDVLFAVFSAISHECHCIFALLYCI